MSLFEPGTVYGQLRDDLSEFTWTHHEDAPRLDRQQQSKSLHWYTVGTILLLLILIGRLLFLQVTQGGSHQLLAQGNRIRNQSVAPPRGVILDRNGVVLAKNVASFGLELVPAYLPQTREDREPVYQLTADLTGQSATQVRESVSGQGLRSLDPLLLLDNLSHPDALLLKVKVRNAPGLRVVDRPRRQYTQAPGLAHLLGYTGKISPEELPTWPSYSLTSSTGKTGLEQGYESLLRGVPGVEQVEVDSTGYLQRIVGTQAPVAGDTVVLSLDLELQRKLGEVLAKKLDEVQSSAGVGMVLDPRDGSVLALVSLPDYNNNEFAAGIASTRYQELLADTRALFTNRAIAGRYPAGSVIKPFVAAAGLGDGVITEQTSINAPGEIRIGEFVFPDWKRHGLTDVKKAIAVSSNVFFYAVGGGWETIRGLGIERLNHYLALFGFGRRTQVDVPGEVEGLIPTPEWKERVKGEPWYLGDTYHASIGQGDLLVTPLQLANATATIANGGTIQTPHLLWKDQPARDASPARQPDGSHGGGRSDAGGPTDGRSGIGPPSQTQATKLDSYQLGVVRAGMRQGVTDGSSRRLQSLPVPWAGKTGTAQFGSEDKTHAWWTGFGPSESPELVMTILVEGGGDGDKVAVPVAEEVLKWYYDRPDPELATP